MDLDIEIDIAEMQRKAPEAAKLLKAMASPHRLMVLCLLLKGEHSVGKLLGELALSQSALSQHLAVLREENLVRTRREAQTIYYSLASPTVTAVLSALHGAYCAPAPGTSEDATH